MVKYGKSNNDIKAFKTDFTTQNDKLVSDIDRIAKIYSEQPIRKFCKICKSPIDVTGNSSFCSHGIKYIRCAHCGHINGEFEETFDFTTRMYENAEYGMAYKSDGQEIYNKRLASIYTPKVEFLTEALANYDVDISNLSVLDVGAGSGYFVGALIKKNIDASGIEVSKSQVDYGNKMLEGSHLTCQSERDVPNVIRNAKADVISFIGVLEHVINFSDVIDAINNNDNIKYIYFSVPMFSYAIFLEALNPNVFNRNLGGAHTHIFTEESLEYLYRENKWDVLGEWRFGTDSADIMRTIVVNLEKDDNMFLAEIFRTKYESILDDIQLIFDLNKFCSEIHVLVKKS